MSEEELPIWQLVNPRNHDIALYRNGQQVASTRKLGTADFKANPDDILEAFELLGTGLSGERVKVDTPFLRGRVEELAKLYQN